MGTCTLALLHDRTAQLLDRVDRQDRVQANNALTIVETMRSEATEVIKVIQQTSTGPRASTLSVHSQVESVRITKDSTRVRIGGTPLMEYPGNVQFVAGRRYHTHGPYLLHIIDGHFSFLRHDQASPRGIQETY